MTVVDPFSRYDPVMDARFSYKIEDVVATLGRICRRTGYPKTIRIDNGSEFVSRDMDLWAYQRNVRLDFSRLGKPPDNAYMFRRGKRPLENFLIPPNVQRQTPIRMPEGSLVHGARR